MALQKVNTYWPFWGEGMNSFGINDAPVTEPLPVPGENEVLARVEAYTVCASDVKMIRMGNDYPLFKNHDFNKHPVRLGHELALSVAKPGENMKKEWPIGKRFGVQPDVYVDGERYCIGVNVPGGMAEYILLGEEIFHSDSGSCAFPVPDDISLSAIAQTEPAACVEAAFKKHTRSTFKPGETILIWIDEKIDKEFLLDIDLTSQHVCLYDPMGYKGKKVKLDVEETFEIKELTDSLFDGVIVVGNPETEKVVELIEHLAPNSIFAWLPDTNPEKYIDADIANIHYNTINLSGTISRVLSNALDESNYRNDLKPGGKVIISGGGGAMGRIHVMRALQQENPPDQVIVTNRRKSRLRALEETFGELAKNKGVELITISVMEDTYKEKIRSIVGESGVSDIIICAPGTSPINDVVEFLSDDGLLVLFAGTKEGQFAKLPIGQVALSNVSITGSSGSHKDDQIEIIKKINNKIFDPNINIAAVAGLDAGKEAVKAVEEGVLAGKIVVYPHLRKLPLTPLRELRKINKTLDSLVATKGWTIEAEEFLLKNYKSNSESS